MTAGELLEALLVYGAAVWIENGRLRFYAPDRHAVPEALLDALKQQAQDLARIVCKEYVCWHCGTSSVRFDVQLRRFVCTHCRRVLVNPQDAFPPLHELLLQAAQAYGFPELRLTRYLVIPAGCEAWRRFCAPPTTDTHRRLHLQAYRKLLFPHEPLPDDSDAQEVEDVIIRFVKTEPVPTGEYLVKVTGITERETRYGVQLEWRLRILNHRQYEGRELRAWTSANNDLGSKLARWCRALGCDPKEGEELDTVDLCGRKAMAQVTVKQREDGTLFNRVEDLYPPREPAPVATSPAPAADYDPFLRE